MTKFWSEKGFEITVIAGMMHYGGSEKLTKYKRKYAVENHQGDVKVWRCHVSESYNSNFVGRLFGYFSFFFSSLYVGLFKLSGKYDVIVVTSPPLFIGMTGYILSVIKKIPYLFEIRDLWPESAIDTGVVTNKYIIKFSFWLEKIIYKKATLINVLTPAFRTALIEKKGINPNKIIYIPNAADFTLSDEYLNNFDNKFIVTYVGAHGLANHLDQVLDTAKLMENNNVLFLLIGQGMEKERLKKLASSKNLTNVRFIDPVPKSEIFKYILASDVGASVLKKVDTFKTVYSNKTFDYMSCKKPILMAIDGVSRKLVEEADAGLDKLIYYLDNPQELKRHGENGYIFAKNNFDRTVLAEKYRNELKNIKTN